jgi:pyruvate/2-oxoglutarate dehydrogenase complex dihydrolipoamide acyltransferase (E2) component
MMNNNDRPLLRACAAGALSALLAFAFTSPATAAPDGRPKMEDNWGGHPARRAAHLEQDAQRLHIQPAQQTQWQAYASAMQSEAGMPMRPAMDADAVTVARQRADLAAAHAAKLAKVADATAALQSVLTPAQRATFADLVRHGGPPLRHPRCDAPPARNAPAMPAE